MPSNRIFVVREMRHNKVIPINTDSNDISKDELKDELAEYIEKNQGLDIESPYNDSEFFRSIKPVIYFLRVFGLFFKRYKYNGKWQTDGWIIMCIFMCCIQLFNLARSCLVYSGSDEFDELLFFKIQSTIWTLENAVKMLGLMYALFKKNKLPLFFQLWTTTCKDKPLGKHLKAVMKFSLMISTNFVIVNISSLILAFLAVPELGDLFLHATWPGIVGSSNNLMFKVMFTICVFVNSGIAMYSVAFMIVLCFALSREFYEVTDEIKSFVEKDGGFSGDLESIRLRHQGLCRMTNILDDSFMVVIAIVYIADVPMSCIILYNAIYVQHTLALTLLNVFWMVILMVHMTIVSIVCALINVAAHTPLEELYRISASQLQNQQIQLIMFMNRLTGGEVGLTAIKMFIINRPTILTVIGMLITYFVLLVQFKTPATAICHCNSTSS
ncbi:hypothetical protein LOTGIDRAFT_152656 [Lottia gigantea]|uniref:Gustatory receptor n=1 Tax=Lottia gigantea TaxID=225164 RepID=V4AUT3_LOTGI|nr:hypothetical protein LOTGIDRAFT_152656 [Lottia gigantea]ESO97566.1 hypothetical protein LOTGIDRAFT_152656 [Lottia gigantea]